MFLFLLAFSSQISAEVFASESGGEWLTLTAISPEDGRIGAEDSITLTFSNNVINEAVRDNNIGAFTLYDADGGIVPIDVILADEQINPDAKRLVSVKPVAALETGGEYTLVISDRMQAKNGSHTEAAYRIAFTVADAATGSDAVSNAAAKNTGADAAVAGTTGDAATGSDAVRVSNISQVMFICAGVAACLLVAILILRKKSAG